MYKAALTAGGSNFRPWNARLGRLRGLGVYSPGEYVIPTTSDGLFQRMDYPFMDPGLNFKPGTQSVRNIKQMPAPAAAPPAGVTGLGRMYRSSGLGLDLSQLTSSPLFWLAAAGAGYYFFVMRKR